MPLGGLLQGAEALQSPVHAGGAHAQTHRREATQVHGEAPSPQAQGPPYIGAVHMGPFLHKQILNTFVL